MIVAGVAIVWMIATSKPSSPPSASDTKAGQRRSSSLSVPEEPVSVRGAARLGDASAPVVVIEYSDFRCPYCAKFAQIVLPELRRKSIQSGNLQLIFKHLPLEELHPEAPAAAQVAECARRQDRFWPVHDALFAAPRGDGRAEFIQISRRFDLDRVKLDTCMVGDSGAQVQADAGEARGLGIRGTPAFLFGRLQPDGRVMGFRWETGLIPVELFERIVHQTLKAGPDQLVGR